MDRRKDKPGKDRSEPFAGPVQDRRNFMKALTALPVAGLLGAAPRSMASAAAKQLPPAPTGGEHLYDPQVLNPYRPTGIPPLEDVVPNHRYIWADLRAFDNASSGFGAEGYLQNLGFKPSAIFLLLSYPDFVFLHDAAAGNQPIEHRFTVYGGDVLPSQSWNTSQLKGLIRAMHHAGVKVLASMFMLSAGKAPGAHDWFQKHPEVLTTRKDGSRLGSVNPLKHLSSGQLFEDVFVPRLVKCLEAFGFDGYHAGDMSTHLSVPLNEADFSDDMVGQFLDWSKIELPSGHSRDSKASVDAMRGRASWILQKQYDKWVAFWRYRWGTYWKKVGTSCKAKGLMVIANQPWTMPPYEAIYRYGFDYKCLEGIGVDALVVETVAGPTKLSGYTPEVNELEKMWLEDATAMVECVKAYAPSIPLVFLLCVQDEHEQWDTLRLAPSFFEKEIFSYVVTFYGSDSGKWTRCLDGFVVCLGVGLSREDWAHVGTIVSRAFASSEPGSLDPGTATSAVWSDQVMEAQLQRHLKGGAEWPYPPLHSYMRDLSAQGACLRSIVRIENIAGVSGPLFLSGGELLSDTARSGLKSWMERQPSRCLMTIGAEHLDLGNQVLWIRDDPEYGDIVFGVASSDQHHAARLQRELSDPLKLYPQSADGSPLVLMVDKATNTLFPVTHEEPGSFLEPLPYLPIFRGFFSKAATAMQCVAPNGVHTTLGTAVSFRRKGDARLVMLLNDKPEYLWCRVVVDGSTAKLRILSLLYPRRPSRIDDHTFDIRIAPDGVAVLELAGA